LIVFGALADVAGTDLAALSTLEDCSGPLSLASVVKSLAADGDLRLVLVLIFGDLAGESLDIAGDVSFGVLAMGSFEDDLLRLLIRMTTAGSSLAFLVSG